MTKKPREDNDFYPTPPDMTRALLNVETFPRVIHEPACGDGAMAHELGNAGYNVVATDLIDRGYGTAPVDFLASEKPAGFGTGYCRALVTNPPFKLGEEFAAHALALGYEHIALLCRLAWLEGGARHRRLFSQHPPSRVWTFSKRRTIWRGDEASPGKGGTVAYAWFVWQRGHAGTQLGWLP